MEKATYEAAGVSIDAAERVVDAIGPLAASTKRSGVLGAIGGFAGRFALDLERYPSPVLVSSTDGVGTKLAIAKAMGLYETIGIDLVAMCVDDLVCVGAEPLFLLDYIAIGVLDPDHVVKVVKGIAQGCRLAGCALIGGETAEHPGVMGKDDLDVAGFCVGVIQSGEELGPERVKDGDLLVGLVSPGLRSNGYSLARHVLLTRGGRDLFAPAWKRATRSLGEELLVPSVIYAQSVLSALAVLGNEKIHAIAHITGGGIPGNLSRVLPPNRDALVDLETFQVPRIFEEIQEAGDIELEEMLRTFNMGIGMVMVVAPESAQELLSTLRSAGQEAVLIGEVVAGSGVVRW